MIQEVINILESSEDLISDFTTLERLSHELKTHKNIVKILYANKIDKKISKELVEQYIERYVNIQKQFLKIQKKISIKYFSDNKYNNCRWEPDFLQKEIIITNNKEIKDEI